MTMITLARIEIELLQLPPSYQISFYDNLNKIIKSKPGHIIFSTLLIQNITHQETNEIPIGDIQLCHGDNKTPLNCFQGPILNGIFKINAEYMDNPDLSIINNNSCTIIKHLIIRRWNEPQLLLVCSDIFLSYNDSWENNPNQQQYSINFTIESNKVNIDNQLYEYYNIMKPYSFSQRIRGILDEM